MNEKGLGSIPDFEILIDGETYKASVATVHDFSLGPEDHGFFTANLSFEGASWGQGLGAYGLDEWDETTKTRVGTAYGFNFIAGIVNRIGSPEVAKGRRVVVLRKAAFEMIDGFATLSDKGEIGVPFFPKKVAK
jgi:hypothetical protein